MKLKEKKKWLLWSHSVVLAYHMNCGLIKSTVMHSMFIGCIKHSHKLSFKEPVCEIMFVCLIPKLAIFTQFNWHWRSKWHKVHYFWGINDYVRTMCVRYVLKNASLKNYVFKRPNPFMTVLKKNATFMRFNLFSYLFYISQLNSHCGIGIKPQISFCQYHLLFISNQHKKI